MIAGKAHAYRRLDEDDAWAAWWTQQHGPLPIPLWVAPTEERALAIHRQWKRVWPKGKWLVTSDIGLRQNELLQWSRQEEERVVLRFTKGRVALPVTAPAPPTPPTQADAPAPPAQLPPKQELIDASAAPPALPVAPPPTALAVPTPSHPPVGVPATAELPRATPAPQTLLPTPTKEEYSASTGRLQSLRRWLALSWRLLCWLAWTNIAFLDEFGGLLRGILGLLWRVACAAVRSCRNTDPLKSLRGAAITAAVVLATSFAGVALGNPALVTNALPSPRPAAEPTLEAAAPPPLVETATPACPTARVTASGVNLRPSAGKGEPPLPKLARYYGQLHSGSHF